MLFRSIERAIVVCAHADDMETLMGATTWLLHQRGVELYELVCTLGDLGTHDLNYTPETLAAVRGKEAREGAALLGDRRAFSAANRSLSGQVACAARALGSADHV